jgi:hypothetical protein
MQSGDRWVVEISLNSYALFSFAGTFNVAGGFVGNASASIDMAAPGNGVKVTSVTIV